MFKNTLITSSKLSWSKNRLRLILGVFFIALAVPTAFLVKHAYSQLKWEAFHHYRLQAEELANRIDSTYQQLIENESARTFTDYSFLNVAANNNSQYLKRSPLSAFPVKSKFPGIIGYFQIDNNGDFTTPLLPPDASMYKEYGIENAEMDQRQQAHSAIYQILSQNKLVSRPATKLALTDAAKPAATTKDKGSAKTAVPSISLQENEQPAEAVATSPSTADIASAEVTSESVEVGKAEPQAAFDKLQEKQSIFSSPSSSPTQQKYPISKGRVDDLKLKKEYQRRSQELQLEQKQAQKQKVIKNKFEESRYKSKQKLASRRIESNVLPEYKVDENISYNRPAKKDKTLQINMFESEIDAFEFSLLESGHFVLYRKVWKNGLRYIQGLLIDPDSFIKNIIARDFYNDSVSQSSQLTIAYQGNILSSLKSQPDTDYYRSSIASSSSNELEGSLLLQKNLSTTLEQLELVFSVSQLPAGPGASIITWLSIILLLILSGGFYALYALGVKQLVLARQQQDFVSAVSHELKTPLTSIRMYGEMLKEGWTTEEKRKQYYDYIYDESERLTRLINNVLQLARMTRNELPVNLQPYTVAELLDNTHSKISSQVERAEFTLNLNCDDEVRNKKLLVDADYFIQVIINLVDNAIKFSAKSETKQIDISCKTLRNNKLVFSIRDYGPGIAKDQLKKIFNLFYRSENELTRETVGTGIGLSLVKQLVTSMQGKIDVINLEPGIEFQLTFNAS